MVILLLSRGAIAGSEWECKSVSCKQTFESDPDIVANNGIAFQFPDYQLVTDEVIEVCDVLLKLVSTIHVIVIGIVTDDDTRILYHVFDKTES